MVFLRLVIHFSDQFFKIVILWPIHNPSVWRHSKIELKEAQICTFSTSGEKRSKPIGNETLKLVSAIFYQIFYFTPNNSPSNTIKNVFYFI